MKIKTPSGKITIQYRKRAHSPKTCNSCGAKLHGITGGMGVAASKRNPSRPYAGVLCSGCSRSKIKNILVR